MLIYLFDNKYYFYFHQKHHSVPATKVGFFTWGFRSSLTRSSEHLKLLLEMITFPLFFRPPIPGDSIDTLYYPAQDVFQNQEPTRTIPSSSSENVYSFGALLQPTNPISSALSDNVFNFGNLRGFVPLFQWLFYSKEYKTRTKTTRNVNSIGLLGLTPLSISSGHINRLLRPQNTWFEERKFKGKSFVFINPDTDESTALNLCGALATSMMPPSCWPPA